MTRNPTRSPLLLKQGPPLPTLSPWLYFPVYGRGPYRNRVIQLVSKSSPPRHLLRYRSLSLCPIHGSGLRHLRGLQPLVQPIYRSPLRPNQRHRTLYNNVHRCKLNLLPPTLLRLGGNATPLLRLPRRLHLLKNCIIPRLPTLIHRYYWIPHNSNPVPN